MGKRGAMEMGANAFWGKWAYTILGKGRMWHTQMIGQMRFIGNGRQFGLGRPQGSPVQNGQMRFGGMGERGIPK